MTNCKFCQTPIDRHEAGRCLNATVLHKHKGIAMSEIDLPFTNYNDGRSSGLWPEIPHYSTDINLAYLLFKEVMKARGQYEAFSAVFEHLPFKTDDFALYLVREWLIMELEDK